MSIKPRPFSSKPVVSIPIYIDQTDIESLCGLKNGSLQKSNTKLKLNQIVPQLPHFGVKSNSTTLLYSKFIVKGLKTDKIPLVQKAFKKKQEITEAGTINKITNPSYKSRLVAHEYENQQFIRDEKQAYIDDHNPSNLQVNNFLRTSSAKVFKREDTVFQKPMTKTNTEANLLLVKKKRPTTAKPQPNIERLSANYSRAKIERPKTANNKSIAHINKKAFQIYDDDFLDSKKPQNDKPLRIESSNKIDHIERNILRVSANCKKSSGSIYLTNANFVESTVSLRKKSKYGEGSKYEKRRSVISKQACFEADNLIPQPQQIFTAADKEREVSQMRSYEVYLENTMPKQYEFLKNKFKEQLRQKGEPEPEVQNDLLSKNLHVQKEQDHENQNDEATKQCLEDYIQACEILQYNIGAKIKGQKPEKTKISTLDIWECKQILELAKLINQPALNLEKAQAKSKLRAMTKNLKYFANLSEPESAKFFGMPFTVVVEEEGKTIIEINEKIMYLYVILNGSAIRQAGKLKSEESVSEQEIYCAQQSLYDGEMFGEPQRPSEKISKKGVTLLEQSILLKVSYEQYLKVFFQGSEFQQKMETLKLVMSNQLQSGLVKEEDLEVLSLALQKSKFASRSLVFREGEIFDKLIFVAKGKLLSINEVIIDRNKSQPQDMKVRDANMLKSRPKSRKSQKTAKRQKPRESPGTLEDSQISIQSMRRENLINYELIKQTGEKIYYYFIKDQATFVKGDSLNWESINPANVVQNLRESALSISQQQSEPVLYSLMSNSDETEIYTLSKFSFSYLPRELKKIFISKSISRAKSSASIQTQKDIKDWDRYKQNLCEQILESKTKKGNSIF